MKNFHTLISKFLILILGFLLLHSCNEIDYSEVNNINKEASSFGSIYEGPASKLIKLQTNLASSKITSYCQEIVESQEKTFDNFSSLGAGVNLMWPGNLIQGKTIKTGDMASIPIGENGRNAIEVKVDAFSSSSSVPSSQVIESPTAGKVQSSLEKIIEGYYNSKTNFPANYSIDIQRAFSSKQLQLALNIGFTGGNGLGLSGSFGLSFNKNKTYYAVTLKQKFFQVSVYPKSGIKGDLGWVRKDYPEAEIDKYVSIDNPPVYISTVTYGRLYTLVYESDENSYKIEQALNFAYKNPTASISGDQKLEYTNLLQKARVYVKQLGGNATEGLESSLGTLAGNFESVRKFIVDGAEVSKNNPGYPIEYTAINVNSNLPVTVKVEDTVKYNECVEDQYIANTYDQAMDKVNRLKSSYGYGCSAKIIIYNNTNNVLVYEDKQAWLGSSFYKNPPALIPPKKYGIIFAVHASGKATGTFNQLSYVLGDTKLSFGTSVPWSYAISNKVLVSFSDITKNVLDKYATRYFSTSNRNGLILKGNMEGGTSPLVEFEVRKN